LWDNVLPFSAFVLELAGVAAHVRGHTSPAVASLLVLSTADVFPRFRVT
jgi:hypothetical protein